MKLVIAIGGNALLRRDQALSADNQLENIRRAAAQLVRVAADNDVLLTHGNGPQVGLLALQSAAYTAVESYPLDVLDAESEGMLGYLLEQELANLLPATRPVVSLLTRVEVDPNDPAFSKPSKPIGPMYTKAQADAVAAPRHWVIGPDGKGFRRLVASPKPLHVPALDAMRWLMDHGALVIAAGGGGIPVTRKPDGVGMQGVEAVIDKDLCSSMLAIELCADCLIIATDVTAVFVSWGLPQERALHHTTPEELATYLFAKGSMAPKIDAACAFVRATGKRAVIGSLEQIEDMLDGRAGTQISSVAHQNASGKFANDEPGVTSE